MQKLLLITNKRRTLYDHSFFTTRERDGILEVIRASDGKVVDAVFPQRISYTKQTLKIVGKELVQ